MATFNSTKMTNLLANTPISAEQGESWGRDRVWIGTMEITAAYTTGDIIRLERLPWNLRPNSLIMAWDDLNSSTLPADLGLYYPNGTVIDIDEFASALALGTATVPTDVLFEAAAADIDRMGKELWEYAGLASMPVGHPSNTGMADLCLTLGTNGGTTAAGTISWCLKGSID